MCSKQRRLAASSETLEAIEHCDGAIREMAHGGYQTLSEALLEEPTARPAFWRSGTLRHSPAVERHRGFGEAGRSIEQLLRMVRTESLEVAALFDGLDRLMTAGSFWKTVQVDFLVLRGFQVSVLAAAPITVLFEVGRTIPDQFDRVHHLPALVVDREKAGALRTVLDRRGGTDILGPGEADLVCAGSGGVLRDLVSLARDAGEEAYIPGADRIEWSHAQKAIGQLGTGYLRGLGPEEIRALAALARTGSFDPHSELNLGLLATRRVLECSPVDFRVHPALLPLIQEAEARIA